MEPNENLKWTHYKSGQLALEWVYGYHGQHCRNNALYTATGEILYFVSTVGIVHNVHNHSQRFFHGHNGEITSIAQNAERNIVATGQRGKSTFICIWNPVTMELISILQGGHKDGIASLDFNDNGHLLVSVGINDEAEIIVWNWRKGTILGSVQESNKVLFVKYAPHSHSSKYQFVTCGLESVKFWSLCGNVLEGTDGQHNNLGVNTTLLCAVFGNKEMTYTGSLSGDIFFWTDCNLHNVLKGVHRGGVTTMARTSDMNFITGGKDSCIKLWNIEFNLILKIDLKLDGMPALRSVHCQHSGDKILVGTQNNQILEVLLQEGNRIICRVEGHCAELVALATHPNNLSFVTGSEDGILSLHSSRWWSITERRLLAQSTLPSGIMSCDYHPCGTYLIVCQNNGPLLIMNAINFSEITHIPCKLEDHTIAKYSPDGTLLAVANNDGQVCIFCSSEGYKTITKWETKSKAAIFRLDWSTDGRFIQIDDSANEHYVYRILDAYCLLDKNEIISWSTWTGILGPEVTGLWLKYSNKCNITSTDVNLDAGLMLIGTKHGKVGIQKFPTFTRGQKQPLLPKMHSSSISNVKFSYNKQHAITTGKYDFAIFQWRINEGIPVNTEAYDKIHEDEFSEDDGNDCNDEHLDSDLEDELLFTETNQQTKEQIRENYKQSMTTMNDWTGKGNREAPKEGLQISFVFGYRGFDCRNNLHFTKSGAIVYHVAAVGIVFNFEKQRQKHYVQHTDDILCLTVHHHREIIATGQAGQNPSIHIWSSENMATLSILKTHLVHGICALDFSDDDKHIVSVSKDEEHHVVVWNWKKGQQIVKTWGHQHRIIALKWNPHKSLQFATSGVKHFRFWTIYGNGFVCKNPGKDTQLAVETVVSIEFGKSSEHCFTGDAKGNIYIWIDHKLYRQLKIHDGPVFTIHVSHMEILTGGKDGIVHLWDSFMGRCLKTYSVEKSLVVGPGQLVHNRPAIKSIDYDQNRLIIGTINGEILSINPMGLIQIVVQGHGQRKILSFDVHPTRKLISTLSDNGVLIQWNIDLLQMDFYSKLDQIGPTCVTYSGDGHQIAIGYINGKVQIIDACKFDNLYEIHRRPQCVSSLKFSPSLPQLLAVGRGKNAVDIFQMTDYRWAIVCHTEFKTLIRHINWSNDGNLLHVSTQTGESSIFDTRTGIKQHVLNEQIQWATWTSTTDISIQTDFNTIVTCLSPDRKLLAAFNNSGFIRLLEYPIIIEHPKSKWYTGHGMEVTGIKWSNDGSKLVSINGSDMAIIVWNRESLLRIRKIYYDSDESDSDCMEDDYDSNASQEMEAITVKRMWKFGQTPVHFCFDNKIHVQKFTNYSLSLSQQKAIHKAKKFKLPQLELKHVFGYHGYGCRDNIYFTNDGLEIIYPSSYIAIIMNTITGNQKFYTRHTDIITSMATNNHFQDLGTVASGQLSGNPAIIVWSTATLLTLSLLKVDHKDGIACLDFSCTGNLLVSIGHDKNHTVTVFKWNEGNLVAQRHAGITTILSVKFRPDDNNKFVTVGQRHVVFWTVAGNELIARKRIVSFDENQSEVTAIKTMLSVTFGKNNVTYTGAVNGSIFVWKSIFLQRIILRAHTGPIYAMYLTLSDGLILTGSTQKSGANLDEACIKLWDQELRRCKPFLVKNYDKAIIVKSVTRCQGKIVLGCSHNAIYEITEKTSYVRELHQSHGEGGVWGLSLHPHQPTMATTGSDQTLKIWDILNLRLKNQLALGSEGYCLDYSVDGEIIAIGQLSGQFLVINSSNLKILSKRKDSEHAITNLKISRCKKFLAVASNEVCIYSISNQWQLCQTGYWYKQKQQSLTVDFTNDSKYLMVTTTQMQSIILSVPHGFLLLHGPKLSLANFDNVSLLQIEVDGKTSSDTCAREVTYCSAISHKHNLIAEANNKGQIKLYALSKDNITKNCKVFSLAPNYSISNMGFSHEDSYMVITGGYDCSVSIWKLKYP